MVWRNPSKEAIDEVQLMKVVVDRGCTFDEAQIHFEQALGSVEMRQEGQFFGFYRTKNAFQGSYSVLLIVEKNNSFSNKLPQNVTIYRPG